jgi:hypothetical protein
MAKGGAVKMFVNDKQVADGRVDETIFVHFLRRRDLRHRARHRLTCQWSTRVAALSRDVSAHPVVG